MDREVFKLAEAVDYRDNSVVSRSFIKNSRGNITLFAFDKGQELSEHTAPFEAFVTILEGSCLFSLAGRTLSLAAGEALVLKPGVPHSVIARDRFKMMLVMIKDF